MWYDVPKEKPAHLTERPRLIFPWETHQPPPTRIFTEPADTPSAPSQEPWGVGPSDTHPSAEPSLTEQSAAEAEKESGSPVTPTIQITPSDIWTSFTRTNAWDEVPEIERYVDKIQQRHRRTRSLKSPGVIQMPGDPSGAVAGREWERRGSKLTDFPSEVERPSLPVTPAPIRRPRFWGGGDPGAGEGDDDDPLLPTAEGVPGQSEWVCVHGRIWKPWDCVCDLTNALRYHKDPVAQLQKLAKQQSEMLLQKLGGASPDGDSLPSRPLPFGSEDLTSPTYVAHSAKVLSPQPVKGSESSSLVRGIVSEEEATPRTSASGQPIEEPSYHGPGAMFEKGEDYPLQETPMPPTEEERDILET